MKKTLNTIFPIMDVEHDCILSKRGDITVAFQVNLPEIFTLSNTDYDALHSAWVKALRIMPIRTILHKQDWFLESCYHADFKNSETSFLTQASNRFFNERPYLQHTCNVFLTLTPDNRYTSSSLFSSLIRPVLVPDQNLNRTILSDFEDKTSQFQRVLEDSGFVNLRRLKNAEILSKRDSKGIVEQYMTLSNSQSTTLMKDLRFEDQVIVGDQHVVLYTLGDAADLPGHCASKNTFERYSTDRTKFSIGFASPLGQLLSCNHIVNQYIFLDDPQRTLSALERKRLRLQSLSAYSRENAIARDATDDFLNEAYGDKRHPVKAHFNIMAWTDREIEVKELKNKISSALSQMNAVAKQETVGAAQIFWAGIPGNAADFPMNDAFDTFAEQAACFFNMETGYQSSLSPVGIRLGDRLTGKPVHVDISDEPMETGVCTNRNKFILGPSGSGKSFFTNHFVRSYYEQGTHIVLVDVGHSYKGLCDMVKGYYFTYTEKNPIRFNPFHIGEGDNLDTEKKESIKTLLLALWKKDNEVFKRSEYVALSNAITAYYDYLSSEPGVFPCFNTFFEFLIDHYVKILEADGVKEKDFDVSNFLYVLRPYYKGGEFDYLLNATENLNLLRERFIVFELDNIKDHPILFPVVTIIIMEVFINKMRKLQGVRKMILIEEAWKALMKEGFAEYIKYLFKTVRKHFGEAIVVTQEIEDIISSQIVKQAIINNSDCKILLDQSKYQNKFDQIQDLLGLSDKEKALVLSVNKSNDPTKKYKEVFISLGSVLSKVYRTEVSTEEYIVYSTEQKEKVRLAKYISQFGGDIRKGIAAMVADLKSKN